MHGVLLLALIAACLVSLLAGAAPLPAEDVWRSGIFQLRLARTVLCLVAGAVGLSAAGVIFQAVLRNPLAEPYVLGVSSGAGLGAALAIVFWLSAAGVWTLPAAAFAGTLATIVLVYSLARTGCGNGPCPDSPPLRRGGHSPCWEAFLCSWRPPHLRKSCTASSGGFWAAYRFSTGGCCALSRLSFWPDLQPVGFLPET